MDTGEETTTQRPPHQRRAAALLALMAMLFGGLLLRLAYINIFMAPRLRVIAEQQHESSTVIPARRGSILDVQGRLLAGSRLRSSVYADPGMIQQPDEVARSLAPILGMDAGLIENEIRSSETPRFCWLKRRVDEAEAEAVERLRISGIGVCGEFERYWPMDELAAHVLGFVGSDGSGLDGLEGLHDAHLRGVPGRRSTLRDARRRAIGSGGGGFREPRDGGHIILTIDSVIQRIVETRLQQQVREYDAKSGVAVVMSPKTGEILAMACFPTFSPEHYAETDPAHRRNRVVTDPVEPGSTYKPFIMAGALQGRFVDPAEKIHCHDGLHYFGGRRMHDTKPHGLMTPGEIIVYSSNIGMGIIGTRMGNEALHSTVTSLGFGAATQVGLPGESAGIVLPVEMWNSYSTTSVPIGQELAVTPMQLANAFCALVNGGYLLRPRIVKARLATDNAVLETYDGPEIIRQVVDKNVARFLREEAMPGVVERGGKELDASPYTMCGKTGTAQVPRKDRRGYEPEAYLSSFVGAAPVSEPRIVALVMILKPDKSKGYYGRVVAGPAVRDIVRSTLEYLGVPPEASDG